MNLQKSADFIADVERQYEWYAVNADWNVADRYLSAVEATCHLLSQHPQLGPVVGFKNERLLHWRFFVVFRPFRKHILFYELRPPYVLPRMPSSIHRCLPSSTCLATW